MSIDSQQLRFFVEVGTLGSIKRAAERMNITQSALSRRMMQLEYDLGVSLLHRSNLGVELTPAGRRLMRKAIFLAGEIDMLRGYASEAEAPGAAATVQFAMTSSASHFLLGDLVYRCNQSHPDILLRVTDYGERVLQSGEVQFAVARLGAESVDLSSRPLWEETLLLVAPKGASMAQISGMPFVHAARQQSVELLIRDSLETMGITPVSIAQITPAATAKKVVLTGASSILPYTIFSSDELERYEIFPVPGARIVSHLIWSSGPAPGGRGAEVVDEIERLVGERIAEADDHFLWSPATR